MELKPALSTLRRQARQATHSRWLPWIMLGLILLAVFVIETPRLPWGASIAGLSQVFFWFLALLGLALIYLTVSRFNELYEQRRQLEKKLFDAEKQAAAVYTRLQTIFQVSQTFVDAGDENDVITPVLRLLVEITGADGASFVPLDEHGQPQAAVSHGVLPFPVMEAWVDYLASPGVRDRCRVCATPEAPEKPQNCPLLKNPLSNTAQLFCQPVRRGEREFGVVTLFSPASLFVAQPGGGDAAIDESTRTYVRILIDETALGLESLHLRRRELNALRQMQNLRQKTDLKSLFDSIVENIRNSLEADFAELVAPGYREPVLSPFLNGIVQGMTASGEPVVVGEISGEKEFRSLIAAPLIASTGENAARRVLGALLVGSSHSRSFQQRQVTLLQTIAGQAALLVHNADLISELEYKTMMQERQRLAREIHDGLAQTLGFLKLQAAQMRGYLGRDEIDRVRATMDAFYTTLTEAYQDARQAIDGLRISPAECGLHCWLEQTAQDFSEVSGLPVSLNIAEDLDNRLEAVDFPPEYHAQLIRIVQEALSNIRKHSQAGRVWVACSWADGSLLLEIRDDGQGFTPEDIALPSRHGLRGMRERAELINAALQITSRPGDGAAVRVKLPTGQFISQPREVVQ